jgi:hypothetical protein
MAVAYSSQHLELILMFRRTGTLQVLKLHNHLVPPHPADLYLALNGKLSSACSSTAHCKGNIEITQMNILPTCFETSSSFVCTLVSHTLVQLSRSTAISPSSDLQIANMGNAASHQVPSAGYNGSSWEPVNSDWLLAHDFSLPASVTTNSAWEHTVPW